MSDDKENKLSNNEYIIERIRAILEKPSAPVLSEDSAEDEEYEPTIEALTVADNLIKDIKDFNNLDYTSKRLEIAEEFDNVLWNGDWESAVA